MSGDPLAAWAEGAFGPLEFPDSAMCRLQVRCHGMNSFICPDLQVGLDVELSLEPDRGVGHRPA